MFSFAAMTRLWQTHPPATKPPDRAPPPHTHTHTLLLDSEMLLPQAPPPHLAPTTPARALRQPLEPPMPRTAAFCAAGCPTLTPYPRTALHLFACASFAAGGRGMVTPHPAGAGREPRLAGLADSRVPRTASPDVVRGLLLPWCPHRASLFLHRPAAPTAPLTSRIALDTCVSPHFFPACPGWLCTSPPAPLEELSGSHPLFGPL